MIERLINPAGHGVRPGAEQNTNMAIISVERRAQDREMDQARHRTARPWTFWYAVGDKVASVRFTCQKRKAPFWLRLLGIPALRGVLNPAYTKKA